MRSKPFDILRPCPLTPFVMTYRRLEGQAEVAATPDGGMPIGEALDCAYGFSQETGLCVVLNHNDRVYRLHADNPTLSIYAAFQAGAEFGVKHGHS